MLVDERQGFAVGSAIKVKASASDLVQESFLEAKRDFGQFTGQSTEEFQAWLRRLLLNNGANVIRSYQGTEKRDISKENAAERFDLPATLPLAGESRTASSIVMKNELLDALPLATQKLPGHDQDVIRGQKIGIKCFRRLVKKLNSLS